MRILISFLFLLYLCIHVLSSFESIFWKNISDDEMLQYINKVESFLNIFIYPIPIDASKFVNKSTENYEKVEPHFRSEYIFVNYYKSSNVSNVKVVSDPSKANIFIIDHDWALLFSNKRCDIIYTEHLPIIINNVIDNYPFYNKSNGVDHFFFASYDKGPFCEPYCYPNSDSSIFKRIKNAVFIGNYGMSQDYYTNHKYNNPVSNECHRSGYDIVIPQLLKKTRLKFHQIFYNNSFPYRFYDTTFVGSTIRYFNNSLVGDRLPLHIMCNENYTNIENFKCFEYDFYHIKEENNSYIFTHRNDLLFKGYFSYQVCGFACWSQRLYESLALYTIPIIVSNGVIQSYEKFINWSKFTVKMSLETWFNESLRNKYLLNVKYESDKYRNITMFCMKRYNKKIKSNFWLNIFTSNKIIIEMKHFNFLNIDCPELYYTFIYNKIKYYHQLIEWIDFNDLMKSKNALKLLHFEMFCRIRKYNIFNDTNEIINELCSRPSDYTANLEYFY